MLKIVVAQTRHMASDILVNIDPGNSFKADFMFVPSQWETSLQSNAASHWVGANLETALGLSPPWQQAITQLNKCWLV